MKSIGKYVVGVLAVLFPALMLWPLDRGFPADWDNHLWLIGYYGEHLRQHGTMPVALDTPEVGGVAYPIYYGYWFYRVLGLCSVRLQAGVVVRLAILLLFAAQYVGVRRTLRRLGTGDDLASSVACLVVWAIYPLTNLYHRGALPEFFAIGWLTCACCGWLDTLAATTRGAVLRRGLRSALFATLAAGTHPITALFGLPLFAVLLTGLALRLRGPGRLTRLALLLPPAGLAAVVLLPWLYAYRMFRAVLMIATFKHVWYFQGLDCWYSRLFPLPLDLRVLGADPATVSTPHLDAQINVPLLILAAVLIGRLWLLSSWGNRFRLAALLAVPGLHGLAAFLLSFSPKGYEHLPELFKMVQYPYRMVSFVNLSLLTLVLFACCFVRRCGQAPSARLLPPAFLAVVVTVAGCGVLVKHVNAVSVRHREPADDAGLTGNEESCRRLAHLPAGFYGYYAYTTVCAIEPMPVGAVVTPLPLTPSGGPVRVRLDRPGYLGTNIQIFPWNRFWIDGRPVEPGEFRQWAPEHLKPVTPWIGPACFAVAVPAGEHEVEQRFVPDGRWRGLDRLAWAALLLWLVGLVALAVRRRCRTAASSLSAAADSAPPRWA
jgi:hypothetical protein